MGLSLGGSVGGTSSSSTGSSNQSNTYSAPQTAVQNAAGSTLSSDLADASAGTLTPGTTAEETTAADQINQTSSGLTGRVNQFLAQRGFGASGQTGEATLQGELGRERNLGTNAANFAGQQNTMNNSNLLAALNYAFTSLGSSASGASSGSGSSWGLGAGVSAAVPGF